MAYFKEIIITFIIIAIVFISGCANPLKNQSKSVVKNEISVPRYSDISVLAFEMDGTSILNYDNKSFTKIDCFKGLSDMLYDNGRSLSVYLQKEGVGQNFDKNKINIVLKNKNITLDKYYNNSDLKLSPKGNKLMFRAFKEDSLESAQGLIIYDINEQKEIPLNSKVLVSGNVYTWLNEDEIIYYGIDSEQKGRSKIYKYNLKQQKESVFLESLQGYVTYLESYNNEGILYLENNVNTYNLVYYNKSLNSKISFENIVNNISSSILNLKNNKLYFVGKSQISLDNQLFELDLEPQNINKITYGFPRQVDSSSKIVIDKEGNICFCGKNKSNEKNEIFMYKLKNNSINLISSSPGFYKLISDNNGAVSK